MSKGTELRDKRIKLGLSDQWIEDILGALSSRGLNPANTCPASKRDRRCAAEDLGGYGKYNPADVAMFQEYYEHALSNYIQDPECPPGVKSWQGGDGEILIGMQGTYSAAFLAVRRNGAIRPSRSPVGVTDVTPELLEYAAAVSRVRSRILALREEKLKAVEAAEAAFKKAADDLAIARREAGL